MSFVTRAGENQSASIIVIASHRGRYLVALPSEVWHRTAARRVLVEGSLVRASENLFSNLAEYDPDTDFTFIRGDSQCLPAASALEQVARSQFGVQLTTSGRSQIGEVGNGQFSRVFHSKEGGSGSRQVRNSRRRCRRGFSKARGGYTGAPPGLSCQDVDSKRSQQVSVALGLGSNRSRIRNPVAGVHRTVGDHREVGSGKAPKIGRPPRKN